MKSILSDDFRQLQPFLAGGGELQQSADVLRLAVPPTQPKRYVDAQIDDYHGLRRRSRFPWSPPLLLSVRARTSHPAAATLQPPSTGEMPSSLLGTAGFGFWNDPFTLTGGGVLAPPSALWFFYASPPSDMAL